MLSVDLDPSDLRLKLPRASRTVGRLRGLARELLSPEPILAAIENYRGIVVDLDQNLKDWSERHGGREDLGCARRCLSGGLQAGDRVVVALGNGPAFIAALAATLEIGASPILVHYQAPPAEMRRTAMRYGAAFALSDNYAAAELSTVGDGRDR